MSSRSTAPETVPRPRERSKVATRVRLSRTVRIVVAGCALTFLAAAPAVADPPRSSNTIDDSHPLPADRVQEPEEEAYPYYISCGHARRETDTPLYGGQPGYSPQLDADGDGLACEVGEY